MFETTERRSDGMHADMNDASVIWRNEKWCSPQAMVKHYQEIKDHEDTKKMLDCPEKSQIGLYKLGEF